MEYDDFMMPQEQAEEEKQGQKVKRVNTNVQMKAVSVEQKQEFEDELNATMERIGASVKSEGLTEVLKLMKQANETQGLNANSKAALKDFQLYLDKISQVFARMLTNVEDAQDMAEMRVKANLESKDKTIIELQGKLTTAQQLNEQATCQTKEHVDKYNTLYTEYTEYKKTTAQMLQKTEAELEKTIKANEELTADKQELRERVLEMESKVKKYDEVAALNTEYAFKLHKYEADNKYQDVEIKRLNEQLKANEIKATEQLETTKKMIQAEYNGVLREEKAKLKEQMNDLKEAELTKQEAMQREFDERYKLLLNELNQIRQHNEEKTPKQQGIAPTRRRTDKT